MTGAKYPPFSFYCGISDSLAFTFKSFFTFSSILMVTSVFIKQNYASENRLLHVQFKLLILVSQRSHISQILLICFIFEVIVQHSKNFQKFKLQVQNYTNQTT